MDDRRDRAVVLVAGMAGLLAARVLADHFAEVVVIERDELPTTASDRRGAAHGRHVHALLARGQRILESLFPALTAAMGASGVPTGDVLERTRMYIARLQAAAAHDPTLSAAFAEVAGLARPPQTLLRPDVALRVHRHGRRP